MSDFVIISDSTSDLSAELREKYAIEYLKMGFHSEERDFEASLDWEDISPERFYTSMEEGVFYKTSQVPVSSISDCFRKHLQGGRDVLYIACSSALSGSINSACVIAEGLKSEFPNNAAYCFDSLISGMGQGLMAIKAAKLRESGASAKEAFEWLSANRMKFNQCGTTDSLEYLRRAGRVKASSAFFGNIFAVKPIVISDPTGQNLAVKKIKGRRNSFTAIVDYIETYIENPDGQTIYVGHANCPQDAELLKQLITERFPKTSVGINTIGPIVGASVGPGTVITYYFGAEKTKQVTA